MLTRNEIQNAEKEMNAIMRRIAETFARREENRARWDEWVAATRVFHNYKNPVFSLWMPESRRKIRNGDRETIEDALLFLEVDPWFFRSGYLKERVLSHLKSAPLTEKDNARLRNIIAAVIRGRCRRELRDYCRMSLRVWTPGWEMQLAKDTSEKEPRQQNSLRYLLRFLESNRDKLTG